MTVSAADRFVERAGPELRDLFWRDVAVAYDLPSRPVPPARIVKERRATFLASPEQLQRRPQQTTAWGNLLLAGDYVDTGLPATIEGAIRSGFAAAGLATACQLRAFSQAIAKGGGDPRALTTEIEQERHRALP